MFKSLAAVMCTLLLYVVQLKMRDLATGFEVSHQAYNFSLDCEVDFCSSCQSKRDVSFLSASPLIDHCLLTTHIEISLAEILTLKVLPLFTPLAGPSKMTYHDH